LGALIPIGQGADAEIKDKLNRTFSFDNLNQLQHNPSGENLFDGDHTLHRVAFRLGCFPVQSGGEKSRKKWFYLLKNVLPAATYNGIVTAQAIKDMLGWALNPMNNVTRVVFDAVEDSGTGVHYIHPNNSTKDTRTAGGNRGVTLNMLLVCPAPLANANVTDIPDTANDIDKHAGTSVERPLPF
jgi:hypothetical protein